VKTVLKFGTENVQKFIGDYKIRDIGSSAGHNLLVGANNFLSIFLKIYSLF